MTEFTVLEQTNSNLLSNVDNSGSQQIPTLELLYPIMENWLGTERPSVPANLCAETAS